MNGLPGFHILDFAITGVALAGLFLPAMGLIAAVLPYGIAALMALIRRDRNGPFVPHWQRVRSRAVAASGIALGVLAVFLVEPRFFRPARGLAPGAALEAGTDSVRLQIETEVSALVDSNQCMGLVVGVVDSSGTHVLGFGRSAPDRDSPPSGSTVFEIGSMTQVFTASLLARMAEKGTVRMEQPVQSLLPDSVSAPTHGDHAIELQHLATHTSGLPRLRPSPMRRFLGALAPFSGIATGYSTTWLYGLLSSLEISHDPGTRVDDSDLGIGLLAHALERAGGADYETLLRREICEPLGMNDTRVKLTASQRDRLAPGMRLGWGAFRGWRVASPVGRWQGPSLAGAGGLRSTANDLLAFLQVHLERSQSPLAGPLAETRRLRYRVAGRPDLGLGWFIDRSGTSAPIVWQHGVTGGCRGYIAMMEGRSLGLVVLTNTPIDVDRLGVTILNRLATRAG